jgi:hypothetical protein
MADNRFDRFRAGPLAADVEIMRPLIGYDLLLRLAAIDAVDPRLAGIDPAVKEIVGAEVVLL